MSGAGLRQRVTRRMLINYVPASDDCQLRTVHTRRRGERIVFVHGLAGYAEEWAPVLDGLDRHDLTAFDLRGHGGSSRHPADVSDVGLVNDVVAVIERCHGARPVTLVGQSVGGVIALLTACKHPDLVSTLVLVEATPGGGPAEPPAPVRAREWLASWSRPFGSRAEAVEFFGGGRRGEVWADGLAADESGLRRRFEEQVLVAMIEGLIGRTWWNEWEAIVARTVVVHGVDGTMTDEDCERMNSTGPKARCVPVANAGHDVHLDQPRAVCEVVRSYSGP